MVRQIGAVKDTYREPAASPASPATNSRAFHFEHLLIGEHWNRDVRLDVGEGGLITGAMPDGPSAGCERVDGWTVPGVPNVHSHSFQRALAGMAEGSGPDSFWTWRDLMYSFIRSLTPEDVEAVTSQVYLEMLKAGFTCVGEFHYLHRPPDGGSYDDPTEMSRRIVAASRRTGLDLIHLPVVYERGGLGGEPLEGGQLRFRMDLEGVVRLQDALRGLLPQDRVGLALHSLRAVFPETIAGLGEVLGGTGDRTEAEGTGSWADVRPTPVHIHVAEQEREVRECLALRGARPVEWLLDHAPVDGRWCLVHATHANEAELDAMATRGAVVGLCPTTEANLGDGVFPLRRFASGGGRFGVGTDSHVSRSPVEELRLLEYGQRLVSRRRSTLGAVDPLDRQSALSGAGGVLLVHAWEDGRRALGLDDGQVGVGRRADLVVLDGEHAALVGRDGPAVLDSWLFSGTDNPVRHVMVAGAWVVRDGRHRREEEIGGRYAKAMKRLRDRL